MDEIVVSGMQRFDRVANAEIHGAAGMVRISAQAGSDPDDIGLTTVALGTDTRHCVIRDVHNVWWGADVNGGGTPRIHGTLYDVRVYNIGWQTTFPGDRETEGGGHGQSIYTQNEGADGQKVIDTCVFAAGFSWMKIYGTNKHIEDFNAGAKSPLNKLAGYSIQHTIFVGKAFLVGGVSYGADAIDIHECAFLDCVLRMGHSGQNGIGVVSDSLLTKGVLIPCRVMAGTKHPTSGRLVAWEALEFVGNVVIIPRGAAVDVTYDSPAWLWDSNSYYSEDEKPFVLRRENPDWNPLDGKSPKMLPAMRLTFAEWQAATGFDKNSNYHEGLPTAPMVREYPVEGLGKRVSNVAVYNPTRLAHINLPNHWVMATVTNILDPADSEEDDRIYMEATSALPEGWTGGRVPPLPREVSPVHGVWRLEEIEGDEDANAAAKIAALEAQIAELKELVLAREAVINGHVIALKSKKEEISALDKIIADNNALVARLREQAQRHILEATEQQKIIDAARDAWEAWGKFGAIMGAKP